MFKTENIRKMNKNGSLEFTTKETVNKTHYKAKSVFENPAAAYVVMAICAAIDFALFYQLLSKVVYDSPLTMYMTTAGLVVGFDFAPCYLGMKYREAKQNYKVDGIIQWILLASFILAFIVNFYLRIVTKDVALGAVETESLLGTVSTETATNPLAPAFAVFAAVIPLVTSFCSFGISYAVSNPLRKELEEMDKELEMIEADMTQTRSVLKEYETDDPYYQRVLEDDAKRLEECVAMTYEKALYAADYVRERIKEQLKDNPAGINELSKGPSEYLLALLSDQSAEQLARNIGEAVRKPDTKTEGNTKTEVETEEPYAA